MRDDVRQPPPLADGQAGGHLHQSLYEGQLLLLRVADGQVAAVHVHLPRHLLGTAQLHLGNAQRPYFQIYSGKCFSSENKTDSE